MEKSQPNPNESQKEPYPNCVKIKHNSFWYIISDHEFVTHWLPNVPTVIKMAGLKRGKYYGRWVKAMHTVGSGKHAKD
jgi:hypothetical protein